MKKNVLKATLLLALAGNCADAVQMAYTFDEGTNYYTATLDGATGIVPTVIAYYQGTTQANNQKPTVAYRTDISPTNRFFAIGPGDLGDLVTNYVFDANVSRFQFGFTVAEDTTVTFSSNTQFRLTISGLRSVTWTPPSTGYRRNSHWVYRVNGGNWSTNGTLKGFDVRSIDPVVNTIFNDAQTDALLQGYGITTSANYRVQTPFWTMEEVGILNAGDTIEFAFFLSDNRTQNHQFYTGVDDFQIDGMQIQSGSTPSPIEPATIQSLQQVAADVLELAVTTGGDALRFYPVASSDLTATAFTNVPHAASMDGPFTYTNLSVSAGADTNRIIYLQIAEDAKFFRIDGE